MAEGDVADAAPTTSPKNKVTKNARPPAAVNTESSKTFAMQRSQRQFLAPAVIDEDIIGEVGGAKTLQDMPEYKLSGGVRIRPPKVVSPKKALAKYYDGPVPGGEGAKAAARREELEKNLREGKGGETKEFQEKEKEKKKNLKFDVFYDEEPKKKTANDELGSDEEWIEVAEDINQRIQKTTHNTRQVREVHYKELDEKEKQFKRPALTANAKGFTLRQPVMIPCPYGVKWSMDVLALPHNAIKRELLDMYRIVESLGKRQLDLRHSEIDDFYNWWEVFEGFILEYFDIEEKYLYRWLGSRIDLKKTKLDYLTRSLEKGRLTRIMREIDDCEEAFIYLPAGEVLPKLVAFLDKFSPRLLAYFGTKEMLLPSLIENKFTVEEKVEFDRIVMEHVMYETVYPTEYMILLTRWLNGPQKTHWRKTNLGGVKRLYYNRWYDEIDEQHFFYVGEFVNRLTEWKASQAARAAAKAAEEAANLELKALARRNKLGGGLTKTDLQKVASLLPPGAKPPAQTGPPKAGQAPKWEREGLPPPWEVGQPGSPASRKLSKFRSGGSLSALQVGQGIPSSPPGSNRNFSPYNSGEIKGGPKSPRSTASLWSPGGSRANMPMSGKLEIGMGMPSSPPGTRSSRGLRKIKSKDKDMDLQPVSLRDVLPAGARPPSSFVLKKGSEAQLGVPVSPKSSGKLGVPVSPKSSGKLGVPVSPKSSN